jgi:hypothetical protein
MASPISAGSRRSAHPSASRLASPATRATVARSARYLGALALLGVGVDHIEQYQVDSYSAVPTIGTLFALNFASATLIALALVAPFRRLAGRWADAGLALLAVSGIGIAAGSLAGLLISESVGLFGFMERGYREAIVISIVLEAATVVLLGLFVVANGFGVRLRDGRISPAEPKPSTGARRSTAAAVLRGPRRHDGRRRRRR